MNRQDMLGIIQKSSLPLQLRVASTMFIAQMNDEQIADLGEKASAVLKCVQAGDKAGFEIGLAKLGLPPQFVAFLSSKAFTHAHNDKGN